MRIIEISESKVGKLSEHIEQGLRHLGKAMQCVDEWMEGGEMHERRGYGMREQEGGRYSGGYGNRYPMPYYGGYGMKDHEDWEEMEEMGERRRRSSRTGRYM